MWHDSFFRPNYSGMVTMKLVVGSEVFELSKVAPDYIVLRNPVDLPPGNGRVVLTIDDRRHEWPVVLNNGARKDSSTVAATRVA